MVLYLSRERKRIFAGIKGGDTMAKKCNLDNLSAEERGAILARRAYQRQWRAENKDKVKAANNRYWLKKAHQTAENTEV